MDFSKINIPEMLKHSLPKRFQDMPPKDFEDFITQLFRDLGYKVDQTSYVGDFGADLIVEKQGRTAIQVKRYAEKNNVGVQDVNQVIGAKDFYKCDKSMIITTSDFTNPALKLCNESNVLKWNWDDLRISICNTYLDGKDVYNFFPELVSNSDEETLKFEVNKIEYNQPMTKIGNCTLIYVTLRNTGPNTYITLGRPIFITKSNKQIEAALWYTGYFSSGVVYSGASVETAFMFRSNQLDRVSVGDRIIFNLSQDNSDPKNYETRVNIESYKSSCYITTLCFGKNSREYLELTFFRDNCLLKYNFGKLIVQFYYKYSGILVALIGNYRIIRSTIKLVLKIISKLISIYNSYLKDGREL